MFQHLRHVLPNCMREMFNSPNRQLSMPAMKGQLQRKLWSDKVSQGDHSKDGKGAKTKFSLQWSADKKDVLSSVAKVSPFCLMSFLLEFWYSNAIM